jgi:hypothetical protein
MESVAQMEGSAGHDKDQRIALWIDAVDAGPGRGLIGITFAPGKQDRHAIGGPWARDLTEDLDAIAAWNASRSSR